MPDATDLAQRQLDAYNAGDIEAFAACYAEDVKVWDLHAGTLTYKGRDKLIARYGPLFERCPELHAELVGRVALEHTAVDEERVTGMVEGEVVRAIAVYEVRDGLIVQVWFARG